MPPDRRRRTVLTGLVLVSLLLITLDYRSPSAGPVGTLRGVAASVFDPLVRGAAALVRPVGNVLGGIAGATSSEERAAALEEENRMLREQLGVQEDLERRLAQAEEQLGLVEDRGLDTAAAHVIGQPPGTVQYAVIVDRGADDGIRPNMAVLNASGLVGKVTQVTAHSAQVQLVTSPTAQYNVRIAETGEQARMTGAGSQPFRLTFPNPDTPAEEGQQVVTNQSGGSAIPDGVRVGLLTGGQSQSRVRGVTPFVDFSQLDLVLIVLDERLRAVGLDPEDVIADPGQTGVRPPPPPSEPATAPEASEASEAPSEAQQADEEAAAAATTSTTAGG
jgi:rod shape-determining protein MreC